MVLSSRLIQGNGKSTSSTLTRCLGQCLLSSRLPQEKAGPRKFTVLFILGLFVCFYRRERVWGEVDVRGRRKGEMEGGEGKEKEGKRESERKG